MTDKKPSTYQVLRNKFPANEYVLICEVSDKSGFSRSRSLDYMLINLWESRGLAITGIECKSHRTDWLKELKNPAKQENHFKYCDHFYLLTDKENVAKLEEIPATWGWVHINEKGILKTMKAAPKLQPIPVDRSLLCAMMRRAADKTGFIHSSEVEDTIQARAEQIADKNKNEFKWKAGEYDELKKMVDDFEKASGINISHRWGDQPAKIGNAVNIFLAQGTEPYKHQLSRVADSIKNIYDNILQNIQAIKNEQN